MNKTIQFENSYINLCKYKVKLAIIDGNELAKEYWKVEAMKKKNLSFTIEGEYFRKLTPEEQKSHNNVLVHFYFLDLMDLIKQGKYDTEEYLELYKIYDGLRSK